MRYDVLSFILTVLVFSCNSPASVIEFTDKSAWQTTAGAYQTIDFTGFAHGTFITNQYTEQYGLTFVGLNSIFHGDSALLPNDQRGLRGLPVSRFRFDTPRNSVAVDYVAAIRFDLYKDGVKFYTSSFFWPGGNAFAGLASSTEFDEVVRRGQLQLMG